MCKMTSSKKLKQAMALLDTMTVKGGKPVPANEDGERGLARIKYGAW